MQYQKPNQKTNYFLTILFQLSLAMSLKILNAKLSCVGLSQVSR